MKARHSNTPASRTPVAPMHRGPQAHDRGQHTGMGTSMVHAPNAALLIDFDNVTMGIRSDLQSELRSLLSSDIIHGKVAVQRAYADWRRYPQYIVPLSEASIDLIFAPAYGSSKKNATDIRLAIDAMELVFTRPEIGTIILLSGDSDFSSLVIKLKEYGKYVIGVGIRESSSDLLVQNCDEYYSYNALAGLVKSGEVETTRKWDPWELAADAVKRMQDNDDVMRSDRLKQVMQEIDSGFNEKELGYSKFSKFCHDAAQKGLIRVAKLENGQLEVGLPGSAPAAREDRPAKAARPEPTRDESAGGDGAPAKPDREGRSRRGRRGGRGRSRGERGDATAPEAPANGTEGVDATTVDAVAPEVADEPIGAPAKEAAAEAVETSAEERPARRPRRPRSRAVETDDGIGASGVRLTRDEAMRLVREAVDAVVNGDDSVGSDVVRRKAFELLGRDSESLSARNFTRILQDAHDADIVDLRRRGDTFEVARAASAASVADQLVEREKEALAAEPAPAEPAARAPRGLARRGPAGRNRAAGRSEPPPDLLSVGVVAAKDE